MWALLFRSANVTFPGQIGVGVAVDEVAIVVAADAGDCYDCYWCLVTNLSCLNCSKWTTSARHLKFVHSGEMRMRLH